MADLTRRRALWLAAAASTTACTEGTGACLTRTSKQTEGPYYPTEPPTRTDITGDQDGVFMLLDITAVDADTCEPLVGAEVDLWGANASGEYSSTADFDTEDEDWMRGQQITDAEGVASFTTLVPGSYPGRAVHLHVKVRPADGGELTTQMYFPADVIDAVIEDDAYAASSGVTANADDDFNEGDTDITVTGNATDGYRGTITLSI